MELITIWRHLFSAVLQLGSGEGPIEERLRDAYRNHLRKVSPNPGLPPHLQGDYRQLMGALSALYSEEQAIDRKTATRLAKQVVAIYDRLTRELH